eukprot:IDg12381t1
MSTALSRSVLLLTLVLLLLTNVPSFVLEGTTALLTSSGPGAIVISGGKITGGGLRRSMTEGPLTLCGATIAGGISLLNVNGDLNAVATGTCKPSSLSGTISVSKGSGNVLIAGGMLVGADVLINEQKGNVEVSNARISDLGINLITGSVTMNSVIADSDGLITGVTGPIKVTKSMFSGDFSITGNHAVTLTGNSFGNDAVSVNRNKGPVTISDNVDFGIVANENTAFTFSNNKVSVGSITKNLGSVSITGSTFTTVNCVENEGFVSSGNSATFATGQCSSFRVPSGAASIGNGGV